MKFEYENKQDDSECVAYIDQDGILVVKDERGNTVEIDTTGGIIYGCDFEPLNATHKFYPGDKIDDYFLKSLDAS